MEVIDIALGVMVGLMFNRILLKPGAAFRTDDTDRKRGFWKQSGLIVYTDHKTGLQYIGSGIGGLTPRLDADGSHIRASE